jgi:hypothetical protein
LSERFPSLADVRPLLREDQTVIVIGGAVSHL